MTYAILDHQAEADDRLAELASLLAAGILRLRLRSAEKSSELSDRSGESLLDGSPDQSIHVDPKNEGISA